MNLLLVFLGGGIGSVLRYLIGLAFQRTIAFLPLATFVSNLAACIIFGLAVLSARQLNLMQPPLRLLLLTGFCGGLSTFSTFGYETFLLFREKLFLYGFLNIVVSCAACILVFILLLPKAE
jgi:CrcB protein